MDGKTPGRAARRDRGRINRGCGVLGLFPVKAAEILADSILKSLFVGSIHLRAATKYKDLRSLARRIFVLFQQPPVGVS